MTQYSQQCPKSPNPYVSNQHSASSTYHYSDTCYNYSKFGRKIPVLQMNLLLPPTHKVDAAISYKIMVHLYQTTHHHIAEGSDHHTHSTHLGNSTHSASKILMHHAVTTQVSLTQQYTPHRKMFLVESISPVKNQVHLLLFSEVKCFLCSIKAFVRTPHHHKT
jgi:hypothetical protein